MGQGLGRVLSHCHCLGKCANRKGRMGNRPPPAPEMVLGKAMKHPAGPPPMSLALIQSHACQESLHRLSGALSGFILKPLTRLPSLLIPTELGPGLQFL
jgi:hypothetical protein